MEIIAQVDGMSRVYTAKTRVAIVVGIIYQKVWISKKGMAAVNFLKAKEHAWWLNGDKHPTQDMN